MIVKKRLRMCFRESHSSSNPLPNQEKHKLYTWLCLIFKDGDLSVQFKSILCFFADGVVVILQLCVKIRGESRHKCETIVLL